MFVFPGFLVLSPPQYSSQGGGCSRTVRETKSLKSLTIRRYAWRDEKDGYWELGQA